MRLALVLLVVVVLSALGVVKLQYQSRKLVTAQAREQAHTHALETEWTQLQLENSTWAAPARVEKIAHERLGMVTPARDNLVSLDAGSPEPAR
jgi:cell division protein FtsL